MKVHTDYLWFETKARQEFIRITDEAVSYTHLTLPTILRV